MATPEEIRVELTELLGKIADTPADAVRDTAALKDLGIDSVATVELAEGVATTFDLRLPNDAVNEWRTVGDVVRSVQRGESFLATLPPPQLSDPERVGAYKQLAVVFAIVGAGIGVFIGVAAAVLLASSGLGGGSLAPISTPTARNPITSATATADPLGNDNAPTPSPTSAAPTNASLTLTPASVNAGEDFQLSGRLPSARDGETLAVEWREGGGGAWAPFPITVTARADGTFESRVYIASPGEREFRVRSDSGSATPPAVVRIS